MSRAALLGARYGGLHRPARVISSHREGFLADGRSVMWRFIAVKHLAFVSYGRGILKPMAHVAENDNDD